MVDDADEDSGAGIKKPELQKPPKFWSSPEPSASTMRKWKGIDLFDHFAGGLMVHSNLDSSVFTDQAVSGEQEEVVIRIAHRTGLLNWRCHQMGSNRDCFSCTLSSTPL